MTVLADNRIIAREHLDAPVSVFASFFEFVVRFFSYYFFYYFNFIFSPVKDA